MKHSLWLVVALLAVPVLERAALAQGTADKPAAPGAPQVQPGAPQAGGPKVLPGAPPAIKAGAPQVLPGGAILAPAKPAEAAPRVSDPQAVAIVENYLKAIGGKETLAKIKDRTTKFRNVKHQATGETVANINLLLKDSILIREEWDIEGFDIKGEKLAFNQIYNGKQEEGWVQMLGTVSPLDGRTLQVFVWDKQMDDFFCHWSEDGYVVTLAGQGMVSKDIAEDKEDAPCDIVQVSDFSGRQQMRYFFAKKNGLILKKEWQDAGTNPKATVKKEQYYKMYRDLPLMDNSGLSVKFALKLEIYLDGDLDTERIFTNVRFNSGLSDKLFDRPEGKAFAPVIGSSKAPGTGGTPANTGAPHGGADADAKSKMRRAVGPHPSGHPGARPAEAKTESTPPVQATPSPAPSPAPSSGASPAPAPAPAPAPPPAGKNP